MSQGSVRSIEPEVEMSMNRRWVRAVLLASGVGLVLLLRLRQGQSRAAKSAPPAPVASMTTPSASNPKIRNFALVLCDENAKMGQRTKCLWELRRIAGEEAIAAMAPALYSPSVLLAHEVAFAMGQMQDPAANPFLSQVLRNRSLDSIVRHEAAEALGAIGSNSSLPILTEFTKDPCEEVAQTCVLALERIQDAAASTGGEALSAYDSVDPANPTAALEACPTAALRDILVDENRSLYTRYQAMFALRNKGTEEAVLALADGFADSSALFKHEIAYVMGQLQHPAAIPSLSKVLRSRHEHAMVRHEAAEALGSIGGATKLLEEYRDDKSINQIIKESCEVALDIEEYWQTDEGVIEGDEMIQQ
eukprot:g33015.t1